MVVNQHKVCIIKVGNFSSLKNKDLMEVLKSMAYFLSDLLKYSREKLASRFDAIKEKNINLSKYNKKVSKTIKNLINEIEVRIIKNSELKSKKHLGNLSDKELYKQLLKEMSKLYSSFLNKFKEKDIFIIFLSGYLKRLIDEIYKRYSGVDVQKYKDSMLQLKNNSISYKYLLARLLGEKLTEILRKINDYDNTTSKEADDLTDLLVSELKRILVKYFDKDEDLNWLRRVYGIV